MKQFRIHSNYKWLIHLMQYSTYKHKHYVIFGNTSTHLKIALSHNIGNAKVVHTENVMKWLHLPTRASKMDY